MSDEIIDAEIVELDPPTKDSVTKTFSGRPRGAKGKVSSFLLESFTKLVDEDDRRNPVAILIDLAMGKACNKDGQPIEVPVSVRGTAAGRRISTFCPPSTTVKFGDTVKIDARQAEAITILSRNPGYRGQAEAMARRVAAAMLPAEAGDSHILRLRAAAAEAPEPEE